MLHDANVPPENDIVELQTSGRRRRELIRQGDCYLHMLPIPRLTENFSDLRPDRCKTEL